MKLSRDEKIYIKILDDGYDLENFVKTHEVLQVERIVIQEFDRNKRYGFMVEYK